MFNRENNKEPNWTIIEPVKGEIRINYSEVNDGELHYYKTQNSDNGFFIIKNSNGQIITRISICEPCDGKLFNLKNNGKEIECNTCGTKWNTNNFKGISGGCIDSPPPKLNHYIESGYIFIKESDLD